MTHEFHSLSSFIVNVICDHNGNLGFLTVILTKLWLDVSSEKKSSVGRRYNSETGQLYLQTTNQHINNLGAA